MTSFLSHSTPRVVTIIGLFPFFFFSDVETLSSSIRQNSYTESPRPGCRPFIESWCLTSVSWMGWTNDWIPQVLLCWPWIFICHPKLVLSFPFYPYHISATSFFMAFHKELRWFANIYICINVHVLFNSIKNKQGSQGHFHIFFFFFRFSFTPLEKKTHSSSWHRFSCVGLSMLIFFPL